MDQDILFDFGEDSTIPSSTIDTTVSDQDYSDLENGDQIVDIDDTSEAADYLTAYLSSKGVDRNNIQLADEDGNVSSVSFDELSDEEKLYILQDSSESALPSEEELQALNFLRSNNMTLQEFAEYQRQLAIEEYTKSQPSTTSIDSYSDEEVIAYDYIKRFGDDMTDEEIDAEIARLKEDPTAFEKRVHLLRQSLKEEELAQDQLYKQEEDAKYAQQQQAFIQTYQAALGNIEHIQNTELDDNDRDELLRFVLEKDSANRTGLSRALDDPTKVLKMAWYLLHGEERVDAMIDYFHNEISKRSNPNTPRAVSRPKSTKTRSDAFKFN